jgi:hypothetical protein
VIRGLILWAATVDTALGVRCPLLAFWSRTYRQAMQRPRYER